MSTPITQLLELSDAYCAATQRTRVAVSKRVFNDGKILDRLQAGADLTISRHQKALRWFSENWPSGVDWPEGIDRPTSASEVAA